MVRPRSTATAARSPAAPPAALRPRMRPATPQGANRMRRPLLAVTLALLAACGISKEEFAAQQRDAQQYKERYQGEADKTASLERKVTEQDEKLTAMQQKLTVRDQEIAQLKTAALKLEEEKGALVAKSAQYEQLTSSLQGQIQSGQVEISELRGKMTVKLKDKVLFASGSTAL